MLCVELRRAHEQKLLPLLRATHCGRQLTSQRGHGCRGSLADAAAGSMFGSPRERQRRPCCDRDQTLEQPSFHPHRQTACHLCERREPEEIPRRWKSATALSLLAHATATHPPRCSTPTTSLRVLLRQGTESRSDAPPIHLWLWPARPCACERWCIECQPRGAQLAHRQHNCKSTLRLNGSPLQRARPSTLQPSHIRHIRSCTHTARSCCDADTAPSWGVGCT
jgi:hypothetical protein